MLALASIPHRILTIATREKNLQKNPNSYQKLGRHSFPTGDIMETPTNLQDRILFLRQQRESRSMIKEAEAELQDLSLCLSLFSNWWKKHNNNNNIMHGTNKRKGKETGFYENETLEVRRADKDCKRERKKNKCTPANWLTMRKGARRRRRNNIIPAQRWESNGRLHPPAVPLLPTWW